MLNKARNNVIKFFDNCSLIISDAKYKTIHGEEIKNIKIKKNPEQMPQRLPAGLVQVTTGTTSKYLLNEIRQIIYSFYRAKETTKKVNSNIMNSIKV